MMVRELTLLSPVSCVITQTFGENDWYYLKLGLKDGHNGIDYGCAIGTPVKAAGNGTVIKKIANDPNGWGMFVDIEHSPGKLFTRYAHLSKFGKGLELKKNIQKGEIIGYTGNTGNSTGPHLHFGVYINGAAVDPMPLLEIAQDGDTEDITAYAKLSGIPATVITDYPLAVREKPDRLSKELKRIVKGTKVIVNAIYAREAWVLTDQGGWSAMFYTGDLYIQPEVEENGEQTT
jgi:hypothetical protein